MKIKLKIEYILALLSLIIFVSCVFIGFNNTILDLHGFRQSQTAISTFYFLQDGIRLDYVTPLFGYPWKVLFEFPTYQIIVALVCKSNHLTLDQNGRLVSIIFFLLCFIPIRAILKELKVNSYQRCVIYALILTSPVYIFWSRTFMLESTVLFFSLSSIALVISFWQKPSILLGILLLTCTTLGALTKITTFLPSMLVGIMLILFIQKKLVFNLKRLFWVGCILLLTFIALLMWTHHADYLKSQNLFSIHITSKALQDWNFGAVQQRVSLDFYKQIGLFTYYNLGPMFFILIMEYLVFIRKRSVLSLFFLIGYILGFLIFANLYFIHIYYYYATAIFALVFMGMEINCIISKYRIFGYFILCITIISSLFTYSNCYYRLQNQNSGLDIVQLGNIIKNNLAKQDIVFICGDDWSSEIPYYSQRKAIMNTGWISEEEVKQVIQQNSKIGMVLVRNNGLYETQCEAAVEYAKKHHYYTTKFLDWTLYKWNLDN